MSDEDKSKVMGHILRVAFTRCYKQQVEGGERTSAPNRHVPTLEEFLKYIEYEGGNNFVTLAESTDAGDVRDFIYKGSHVHTTCKGSGILMETFHMTSVSILSFIDDNNFQLDKFTDGSSDGRILEALTAAYKKREAEATPEEKEALRVEEDAKKAAIKDEESAKKLLQGAVAGNGNPVPLWTVGPDNKPFGLFVREDIARFLTSNAGAAFLTRTDVTNAVNSPFEKAMDRLFKSVIFQALKLNSDIMPEFDGILSDPDIGGKEVVRMIINSPKQRADDFERKKILTRQWADFEQIDNETCATAFARLIQIREGLENYDVTVTDNTAIMIIVDAFTGAPGHALTVMCQTALAENNTVNKVDYHVMRDNMIARDTIANNFNKQHNKRARAVTATPSTDDNKNKHARTDTNSVPRIPQAHFEEAITKVDPLLEQGNHAEAARVLENFSLTHIRMN